MLRYYGDEQKELIFRTVYTLEEEKIIREKLRLRDLELQQSMMPST